MTQNNNSRAVIENLIAGGVAGAVSRTIVSPLERIKILFQVQGSKLVVGHFDGVVKSLVRIGKEEGVLGYFKGNLTNIIRIFPYSAVQFAVFEQCKKVKSLQIPSLDIYWKHG